MFDVFCRLTIHLHFGIEGNFCRRLGSKCLTFLLKQSETELKSEKLIIFVRSLLRASLCTLSTFVDLSFIYIYSESLHWLAGEVHFSFHHRQLHLRIDKRRIGNDTAQKFTIISAEGLRSRRSPSQDFLHWLLSRAMTEQGWHVARLTRW